MNRDITLIHISDLHTFDPALNLRKLLRTNKITSKRVLGWFNHQFNRVDHFRPETSVRLFNFLKTSEWDYLIISGDISTLALESEFEIARKRLEPLIKKNPVILVPGNHDRYTRAVTRPDLMKSYFPDCYPFNQNYHNGEFPSLYINDKAVLFSIDTAVPQWYLSSRGKVLTSISKLSSFLSDQPKELIKIGIGHYPIVIPPDQADGKLHGLAGKKKLYDLIQKQPIDIYLHGHIHKSWQYNDESFPNTTWVNSGGCCRYHSGDWSGFHRIILKNSTFSIERIKLNP